MMALPRRYFLKGDLMNLKKLSLKLAALTMGVVGLSHMAIPARAAGGGDLCVIEFCSTSTSVGQCGDGNYSDCEECYGFDGSVEYSNDCLR